MMKNLTWPLLLLVSMMCGQPSFAQTASMPQELIGAWTFRSQEQCGYLTIDRRVLGTQEDFTCTVLSVTKEKGSDDSSASYSIRMSCQVDDPGKKVFSGRLVLTKFDNAAILVMALAAEPKGRNRVSLPSLQVFKKC